MPLLPPSLVEDAWHELNTGDAARVRGLVQRFRTEQPVLSGFLRAAEEGVFANDDRGQLLTYGLWAWWAFKKAGGATHEITAEMIDAAFDANHRILGDLEHSREKNVMDAAGDWTMTYRQMPLLAAIMQQVMHGHLDDTRRIDDFTGLIALYMKTVIDCLE